MYSSINLFGNARLFGLLVAMLLTAHTISFAQITNTGFLDTNAVKAAGKMTVQGYVDAYYGQSTGSFNEGNRPYAVSFSRTEEATVNLAYVDLRYSSSTVRARVVPAFGTYMTANYSAEPGYLQNLLEASAGLRLNEKWDVWLEGGIIGSPYTNESAISRDHLMLTRSLAAEYVPYYLSGARLSAAISPKLNVYAYLLNGWQVIQDNNRQKSFGTQVEYRPTSTLLVNWNTYFGYEGSAVTPDFRGRQFSDIYFIFNPSKKWSFTSCLYVGRQEVAEQDARIWYNANAIGRYSLTDNLSIGLRYEWFSDPNGAVSTRLLGASPAGLNTQSGTVGVSYKVNDLMLLRADTRHFFGSNDAFANADGSLTASNTWFVLGCNIKY